MKKVFYHLGLCVVLVCALLGSLQTQSLRIQLREGIPERKAVDGKGIVHDLDRKPTIAGNRNPIAPI